MSMPTRFHAAGIHGFTARPVMVEADIHPGMPKFNIVGMPDVAVQEARERVRFAIKNSGFQFPQRRVTVNLAPADVRKEGGRFDLPIAIAIIAAMGELVAEQTEKMLCLGEVALNGEIRPVPGVLAIALMAKEQGYQTLIVPAANAHEAALVAGITVLGAPTLSAVVKHLNGTDRLQPLATQPLVIVPSPFQVDVADIRGQQQAKRALEIAAAGGHNIRLVGPPGSGKTMLSQALISILPPPTVTEALEITRLYSIAGLLPGGVVETSRPFRQPHHSASPAALIGGGSTPRPGEISLAHRGVLFLDEFPEFPRTVIEALRQPLEHGTIAVSRVAHTVVFPARFILVAAHNPCPCGFHHDQHVACRCSAFQIVQYQKKISGPIIDRIDLTVSVPRVSFDDLAAKTRGETSATVRERVARARAAQAKRFDGTAIQTNAEMDARQVTRWCQLDQSSHQLLRTVATRFHFSGRAIHRLLKVSRTIADLAGESMLTVDHVAEAIQYRHQG